MIWVYAICDRDTVLHPGQTGLAGAPLEGVAEGDLLAVVSRHTKLPEVDTDAALWAHEQAVEAVMAGSAVLPMRFGSQLADDTALRVALAAHEDRLLAALDAVRGRIELAVRVIRTEPPVPEPAPADRTGRGFVDARLALRARDEAAAAALHAPLTAMAVAGTRRPPRAPGELLRASYLVERSALPAFRDATQRLQLRHGEVAVLCTGPWPPYSFVGVPPLGTDGRERADG
jgi:hypothetical protein